VLLIAGFVGLVLRHPASKPAITIGVREYKSSVAVILEITNTGRTTIRYSPGNFDPDAWVQAVSQKGWTSRRSIGPLAGMVSMSALLRPGSNTFALIVLPRDTLRWQVGYKVRAASLRRRVQSRMPAKLWNALRPFLERILSDKEGPEREVVSPVFDCPHSQPFDPAAPWFEETDPEPQESPDEFLIS
jgi:hypothetical protein